MVHNIRGCFNQNVFTWFSVKPNSESFEWIQSPVHPELLEHIEIEQLQKNQLFTYFYFSHLILSSNSQSAILIIWSIVKGF